MSDDDSIADHPSSEAIADFINGRLSPEVRSTVESHLAECRTCRQQVVSARRLLDTYQGRRPMRLALPVAAIALVLIVFVPRMMSRTPPSDAMRGRSGPNTEGLPRLTIVAPPDGDSIVAGQVMFVWRNQPGQPLFRLTLTDGVRELWSVSTPDTSAKLPDSVRLAPARSYSWYVDAIGADGRSLTSGTQRFQVKQ
jgi:hypothetical protein